MNFYRYRKNYWSCSQFANWILSLVKVQKPEAETTQGWKLWKNTTIAAHPWIYTLVEDWLDNIQDVVYFPYDVYDNIRLYLRNRFITRSHLINTKLKPGQWHETDEKLLHGMFELLVDFVEIEKAHMHNWCKPYQEKPWYLRWRSLRWGVNRSRENGLAYLDWEKTLTDDGRHFTTQALAAYEQEALYLWWKDVRPNRPDPYDITGWTAYNDKLGPTEFLDRELNDEDSKEMHRLSQKVWDLEESWNEEDEQMLTRLIKLRRTLWT